MGRKQERMGMRGQGWVVWRKERGDSDRDRTRVRKMVSRARWTRAEPGGGAETDRQTDDGSACSPPGAGPFCSPATQEPQGLAWDPFWPLRGSPRVGGGQGFLRKDQNQLFRPERFGTAHPGIQEEGPSRSHVAWGRVEGWTGRGPELIR